MVGVYIQASENHIQQISSIYILDSHNVCLLWLINALSFYCGNSLQQLIIKPNYTTISVLQCLHMLAKCQPVFSQLHLDTFCVSRLSICSFYVLLASSCRYSLFCDPSRNM